MKNYFIQLFAQLKDIFIIMLATIGAFIGPIAPIILSAIFLAFFDVLTAISAAKKNSDPITSDKLGKTFPKLTMYVGLLIAMHYLDVHVVEGLRANFIDQLLLLFMNHDIVDILNNFKLTSAVGTLIIIRECVSIDENWKKYFGWSFYASGKEIVSTVFNKFKINKNAN